MTILKKFGIALFAICAAAFVSCGDDEDETPSIARFADASTGANVTFEGMSFSDFPAGALYRVTADDKRLTVSSLSEISSTDKIFPAVYFYDGAWNVKGAIIYEGDEKHGIMRSKFNTTSDGSVVDSSKGINFNMQSLDSLSVSDTKIDFSQVVGYIAVKPQSDGTITVTYENSPTEGITKLKEVIALVKSDGTILKSALVDNRYKVDGTIKKAQNLTISADVSANTPVFLIYCRNRKGGELDASVRIKKFEFEASASSSFEASASSSFEVGSKYKGSFYYNGSTIYHIITFSSATNWSSKGYYDSACTQSAGNVGTDSGTYSISDKTLSMSGSVINNATGTFSSDFKSFTVDSGTYAGKTWTKM